LKTIIDVFKPISSVAYKSFPAKSIISSEIFLFLKAIYPKILFFIIKLFYFAVSLLLALFLEKSNNILQNLSDKRIFS
jgi:hypothetical protein